jgi:hypothetical protein
MFAALVVLAGCNRPRSPEEALARIERALAAGDAAALYDCLDRPTRWAIDSTLHDQKLMRSIIAAKYPADEAARALGRLEAAAEDDAPRFFARVEGARGLVERYRARLGRSGPVVRHADGGDAVLIGRGEGAPLRLVRARDGSWGLAELEAEWTLEQDRASHALKTVHDNAALYGQAGGR